MGTETRSGAPKSSRLKKDARLEARVTAEQKQLMERAAGLRGQNLTEFMVAVLAEAATQIVKDSDLIELTDRDRQAFTEALLKPTPPSDQAYTDAQWYRQVMNQLSIPSC
ncbi:DUF1778 domain-containing protein [Synechococcales cyanobacterium C]|uniref:DUF1778 domain-containing protein n=2 Tax=Petrachloros TaxID=2918834 RepID=A0A8K2A6B5_9CYAN|nr:DUF1778 domain-containing protein [Petrachloros mirabilis]NCJ05929.1 DUF1778 domain-containing protein [Petrachloros mirabilis ULC683]